MDKLFETVLKEEVENKKPLSSRENFAIYIDPYEL